MIVLTGATGRTGSAAAEALRAKGEKVRVVGRDAKKLSPLARLAAEAFVGNVEDVSSMTEAFKGASAVYLVLPEDISNPTSTAVGVISGKTVDSLAQTRLFAQRSLGSGLNSD